MSDNLNSDQNSSSRNSSATDLTSIKSQLKKDNDGKVKKGKLIFYLWSFRWMNNMIVIPERYCCLCSWAGHESKILAKYGVDGTQTHSPVKIKTKVQITVSESFWARWF